MNKKRVAAIAGLCLIGIMYIATIIFALMDSPFARSCLMASLFCTIVIPVIIYAYLMLLNIWNRREENTEKDSEDL